MCEYFYKIYEKKINMVLKFSDFYSKLGDDFV